MRVISRAAVSEDMPQPRVAIATFFKLFLSPLPGYICLPFKFLRRFESIQKSDVVFGHIEWNEIELTDRAFRNIPPYFLRNAVSLPSLRYSFIGVGEIVEQQKFQRREKAEMNDGTKRNGFHKWVVYAFDGFLDHRPDAVVLLPLKAFRIDRALCQVRERLPTGIGSVQSIERG